MLANSQGFTSSPQAILTIGISSGTSSNKTSNKHNKDHLNQRPINSFGKEPDSILGFVGHIQSVAMTRLSQGSAKTALDNMKTNGHGYAVIQFYLWTLDFEVHLICAYCKIFFF